MVFNITWDKCTVFSLIGHLKIVMCVQTVRDEAELNRRLKTAANLFLTRLEFLGLARAGPEGDVQCAVLKRMETLSIFLF
jgi:hypothetical protein